MSYCSSYCCTVPLARIKVDRMLPDAARSPLAWAARWLRAVRQLPAPGSQAGSAFYRLVRAALEAIGERAASLGCALWAVFYS